ncbi:MAG: hypothetical protein CK532_03625 [Flavobacteriales bacterium]|nr:MAG: hypothetical protein CK532_03625 [Flavobacteriales bacterium]
MGIAEFLTSEAYFRTMKTTQLFWILCLIVSCRSDFDTAYQKVEAYETLIIPHIQFEKIPDSACNILMSFAKDYPKYKHSSDFVYVSTKLAERQGFSLKTAEYSEFYLQQYKPTGKLLMEMMLVAAHNFEQGGGYANALIYYKRLASEFSDKEIGKQAIVMIEMLNLGIKSPEEQMNYCINRNKNSQLASDSAISRSDKTQQ